MKNIDSSHHPLPLQVIIKSSFFLLFLCIFLNACTTVAPYQRVYLNDPEMQMGQTSVKGFENYILTIREGATPAGGAKTSGGCGCN